MSVKVAVLDYGIGNLHSAQKALLHVGADARLTTDRTEVVAADAVVLPGVGGFGATMKALARTGLDEIARDSVTSGQPFLGICVGMQVLYERSVENPDVAGLGVLPGEIQHLSDQVKRPQMQWNVLHVRNAEHRLLQGLDQQWFYFVHSYAPEMTEDVIATTEYGGHVVAAAGSGNVWATQFHPEKSAAAGLRLLSNFVDAQKATGPNL